LAPGYIGPSPGITFKGLLTICYGVKAIADDDRAFASGEKTMFIAMNRFRVKRGAEDAFEKVWLSRDSYLERVPGFVEFHLLKGPEAEDHTLYASHTVWQSKAAFEAWTSDMSGVGGQRGHCADIMNVSRLDPQRNRSGLMI
jgi:heme-degrading monooxygenase HmoA